MKQRAVEILFRHKLLLSLPLIMILPLMTWLALRQPAQWETTARIWVQQDPSIYTDARLGATPALNQATLLNDFLQSRTFGLAVLRQTRLAPELRTPRDIDKALNMFDKSVHATATSNNFIDITVEMPEREESFQTTQAIISNYQSTLQSQQEALNAQAVKLYGDSLQQAQDAVTQAQLGVSNYLASHPALAGAASGLPLASRDASYAVLTENLANAQAAYDTIRGRYFDAQSAGVLSGRFAPFAFNVIDPPERPTAPLQGRGLALLKLPIIGFALGLLISAAIGATLVLADHTVVGAFDLQRMADVVILGEMPELPTRKRIWQSAPPDVVRWRLSQPGRNA